MSDDDHEKDAVLDTRTVSLSGARRIIDAALARAEELNCRVSIVVIDAGGNVSALARRDGTGAAATAIALNKATTALTLRQATDLFVDSVRENLVLVTSLASQPGFALNAGGLPITVDGAVVGAIGVSGARDGKDVVIARAGVDALDA